VAVRGGAAAEAGEAINALTSESNENDPGLDDDGPNPSVGVMLVVVAANLGAPALLYGLLYLIGDLHLWLFLVLSPFVIFACLGYWVNARMAELKPACHKDCTKDSWESGSSRQTGPLGLSRHEPQE
jgi:hypothetical protein